MDLTAAKISARFETAVFLDHFSSSPGHRQVRKVMYPLDEVLLLARLAVLAEAESYTDIVRFGEKKRDHLRPTVCQPAVTKLAFQTRGVLEMLMYMVTMITCSKSSYSNHNIVLLVIMFPTGKTRMTI